MKKPGSRVVALRNTISDVAYVYGFGVYVGDEPFPTGWMVGIPNPKIVLDSGEVVWGCQCWWGCEEAFNQKNKRRIEIVPVPKLEEA